MYPVNYTEFCCGKGTSTRCNYPTEGSTNPINIPFGLVVYNRTSGSTDPNITSAATIITSTVTRTAAALSSNCDHATTAPTTASVLSSRTDQAAIVNATAAALCSNNDEVAIGVAVGAFLGLALLAFLGLLWRQRKRERIMKDKISAMEEKYEVLAKMKNEKNRDQRHEPTQLEDIRTTNELNVSRAPPTHEMEDMRLIHEPS